MKITPISNNLIYENKINKKTNTFQKSYIKTTKNNIISFNGLEKLALKLEGLSLQAESKRNLKHADKILIESNKIQQRSEDLLLRAQIHKTFANQILEEEMAAIRAARGFGSKINFTDLEDGIISKTSRPLADGGTQISTIRTDGTNRQIFIRKGKICIYECNEYQEIKQLFVFDLYTHELKTVGKNFRAAQNYSMFDEKYEFQNGQLVLFDENLTVNNEGTYEKALSRFEFKEGKLFECVKHLENIEDFRGELGQVFCFSDGKIYEYDEEVHKDFNTELTSSKKRFIFEPDSTLSFCLIGDKDIDDTWSKFKKLFEYKNRLIKTIDLGVSDNNETMNSRKTFGYENDELAYCNIGEKTNTNTTFERRITF